MRVFCAVAIIALLTGPLLAGPAHAQDEDNHIPRYGEEDKEKTDQQKRSEKAAEKAYRGSLGNIPDKGPVDPWGSARAAEAPKAAAKPVAKDTPVKRTKTGSTGN
jgi:hypothetical protein